MKTKEEIIAAWKEVDQQMELIGNELERCWQMAHESHNHELANRIESLQWREVSIGCIRRLLEDVMEECVIVAEENAQTKNLDEYLKLKQKFETLQRVLNQ